MTTHKTISITTVDLRNHIPAVRKGLKNNTRYVLLYRGRPIAEIGEISEEVDAMFFDDKDKMPKLNPRVERLKKKVAGRRKKRLGRGR